MKSSTNKKDVAPLGVSSVNLLFWSSRCRRESSATKTRGASSSLNSIDAEKETSVYKQIHDRIKKQLSYERLIYARKDTRKRESHEREGA